MTADQTVQPSGFATFRADRRRGFVALAGIAVAGWAFANLVFSPPGLSPDSLTHYQQALTGQYDTVKPPLTSMLMRLCNQIGRPSVRTYVLMQSALLFGAIAVFASAVSRGPIVRILTAAALSWNPITLVYAATAWVDVPMAAYCMLGIAASLAYWRARRPGQLALAAATFFLAASVRHEAVIVPLALAAFAGVACALSRRGHAVRQVAAAMALAVAIIPASALWEHLPNVKRVNWSHILFINQYVAILHNARLHGKSTSTDYQRYVQQIDDAMGPGTATRLMDTYAVMPNGYTWLYVNPILSWDRLVERGRFFRTELPGMIERFPVEWLVHKRDYLRVLATAMPPQLCVGFCIDPVYRVPDPEWTGVTRQRSGRVLAIQHAVTMASDRMMRSVPMKLAVAVPFAAALGLLGLWRRQPRVALPLAAGLAHAAVFVAMDVYYEWRYFFFFYLVYAAVALEALAHLTGSVRRRLAGTAPPTISASSVAQENVAAMASRAHQSPRP